MLGFSVNLASARPARAFVILICWLLIGLGLSCQKPASQQVIAHVGDVVLTAEDLQEAVPVIRNQKLGRVQAERHVQQWLENELIYQKAVEEKFDRQKAVRRQLENVQKECIVSAYLYDRLDQQVQVTDEELQAYFQQNSEEFKTAEDLYCLELILVETLAQAKEIRSRISNGEEFAAIATASSMDYSRNQGGRLGCVPLRRLSPMLAAAAAKMNLQELSQPIKSEPGYAILRLLDITKKGQVRTFAEVQDQILQRVRANKREEMYQKLIARLSDQIDVGSDLTALSLDNE